MVKKQEEKNTIIYKETKEKFESDDWLFWSTRITPNEKIYVYYKLVTEKESEVYYDNLFN